MSDEIADAIEGAKAYEALHVEALFKQWASPLLDAARVDAGGHILDVACGTGIVAREALRRVGPTGSVTGLDIDAGMLTVAASLEPTVEWRQGSATELPFADGAFDAVVSQFGLMFFPDKVGAIAEMIRCCKPDGRVVVTVWDSLERSSAFPISVDLLDRRAGADAADALRAPFVLGDTAQLQETFQRAGAATVTIETRAGVARFPSVRTMVEADLRGWLPVMGVILDEPLIDSILEEAEEVLQAYVTTDGAMEFDTSAHIITVDV